MYHRGPPIPTPSREQQLSDEVRYLHSLWHQSPPNQSPNKPSKSSTNPTPPSSISKISKISKIKKKIVKKKNKKQTPPQVEWPCNSPIAEDTRPWEEIGWPEQAPKPEITPVPIEEQKRLSAVQLQRKSVKACQDFLHSESESESESEEDDCSEEEDSSEEDEDEMDETVETEFFLRLFEEDNELREYYENNSESGEFCCLVCGGIGQKIGKRYKNCVALVQHSVAISKTKKRSAHRAFGKAVCRVLGWDMKRLPNIVLSLDDPLGCHLVKPDSAENTEGADGCAVKDTRNKAGGSVESDKCEVGLNKKVDDKEPVGTSTNAADVEVYNVDDDDEFDVDELYKDLENDNLGPV